MRLVWKKRAFGYEAKGERYTYRLIDMRPLGGAAGWMPKRKLNGEWRGWNMRCCYRSGREVCQHYEDSDEYKRKRGADEQREVSSKGEQGVWWMHDEPGD